MSKGYINGKDLEGFGPILHGLFEKEYPDLVNVNYQLFIKPGLSGRVWKAIESTLTEIGATIPTTSVIGGGVRPCDIVRFPRGKGNDKHYLVTNIFNDGDISSVPNMGDSEKDALRAGMEIGDGSYIVFRPDFSKVNDDLLVNSVKKYLPDKINETFQRNSQTFRTVGVTVPDSTLQIGDIIFIVDPTQLSFVTQNGYHYFPTIRTAGNPKVPTMQQVKNINISLIFPNESSINYQLLPLFAMFKRTPFVNVRNKDINKFYSELRPHDERWVSVALESIHVQSIDGFPNSVQAQITLLPFDSRSISSGLRVLRSMEDVEKQQLKSLQEQERKEQERKGDLQLKSKSTEAINIVDYLSLNVNHTDNYRESVPFRAFYQSLIRDREYVLDERGRKVPVTTLGGTRVADGFRLDGLRPTNSKNMLRHYHSESNQKPITLTYQYINSSFEDLGKELSNARKNKMQEKIRLLDEMTELLKAGGKRGKQNMINLMMATFVDLQDVFAAGEYEVNRAQNVIQMWAVKHGIDIEGLDRIQINNEWDYMTKGITNMLSRGQLLKIALPNVSAVLETARKIKEDGVETHESNLVGDIIRRTQHINSRDDQFTSEDGFSTLMKAFDGLWNWMSKSTDRKQKFSSFLHNIVVDLKADLTKEFIVLDVSQDPQHPWVPKRLPIQTVDLKIDNRDDVIIGWNMSYSNKFVPIHLQASQYPYYQHIGQDDVIMSLRIQSNPSSKNVKLKDELNKLSDRLYQSTKITMLNTPQLISYLKPWVLITSDSPHTIFDCFGVNQVAIDSANTTNIQGSPESWNTVIKLTQNNFTVDEYHAIERKEENDGMELEIAKLIPRIIIGSTVSEDGTIVPSSNSNLATVVDYFQTPSSAVDPAQFIGDVATDLEDIIALSFMHSEWGAKLETFMNKEFADRDTSPQALGDTSLYDYRKLLKEMYVPVPDATSTNNLRQMMKNEHFRDIIKYIVSRWNDMLRIEYNSLEETLKSIRRAKGSQLRRLYKELAKGAPLEELSSVNLGLMASAMIKKPGIAPTASVPIIGGLLINSEINIALDEIKAHFSNYIDSVLAQYRKSMLMEFGHAIRKDPSFRKKLATIENINSDEFYKFERSLEDRPLNTYKDFDVPPIYKGVVDSGVATIRLDPDFYMYNDSAPDQEVFNVIDNEVSNITDLHTIGLMRSVITYQDVIKRFREIRDELQDDIKEIADIVESEELGITYNDGKINRLASPIEVESAYNDALVKLDTFYLSLSTGAAQFKITEKKKDALLAEFDNGYKDKYTDTTGKLNEEEFNKARAEVKKSLDANLPTIENTDHWKLNVILAARAQTLVEIMLMYQSINTYLAGDLIKPDKKTDKNKADLFNNVSTLDEDTRKELQELKKVIFTVLENYRQTKAAKGKDDKKKKVDLAKELSNKFHKGVAAVGYNQETEKTKSKTKSDADKPDVLSIPDIRFLENHLYNKIGYYIRLNRVIEDYHMMSAPISFDELPELDMLSYWNQRAWEAGYRKTALKRDLLEHYQRDNRHTIKLFPAFKFYFIENERGIFRKLNTYFSYDAVQSIEIHRSKENAGMTARVILSNAVGSLTDRMSFARKPANYFQTEMPSDPDTTFFGSLDIKPGCHVLIKMGYGGNDEELHSVFCGKIIEMNSGPTIEMICQSYSTQLNHEIPKHKFGFWSSHKGMGDIASAILDMIPGIEKLGKVEQLARGIIKFSGKNLDKFKGNYFNRFFLSNALGKISNDSYIQDNPRDTNIYLPYDIVAGQSGTFLHKPTFDWVVYNQTVWECLQELTLYNRDTVALTRFYNDDPHSTKDDIRETIVVGDKTGYYKHTDAFGFSSFNTDRINEIVAQWNDIIRPIIKSFSDLVRKSRLSQGWIGRGTYPVEEDVAELAFNKIFIATSQNRSTDALIGEVIDAYQLGELTKNSVDLETKLLRLGRTKTKITYPMRATIKPNIHVLDYRLNPLLKPVFEFFQDELSYKVILFYIAKYTLDEFDRSLVSKISGLLAHNMPSIIGDFDDDRRRLTSAIVTFGGDSEIPSESILNTNFQREKPKKMAHFTNILARFYDVLHSKDPLSFELIPEEYYGVSEIDHNTDKKFINDPRYKKIQKHHFATDISNIVANNIALNGSFPNVVNLYYFTEPTFISESSFSHKDYDKLNLWTVKSFGDLKDEHVRPLNSFQKNIDTNWWEIRETFGKGAGIWKKMRADSAAEIDAYIKNNVQETYNKNGTEYRTRGGKFSLNEPHWRAFPAFTTVGVNLLQRSVEKMYQGTIELIGDPTIEPYDIIHIQDWTNDMHGAIEVQEVVHMFTPDKGFRTIITPNLITYDRDPIQNADSSTINRIFDFAGKRAFSNGLFKTGVGLGLTAVGLTALGYGAVPLAATGLTTGIPLLYSGTLGMAKSYTRFIYDAMGAVLGRDCINFTALIHHSVPFMAGFGGVDYTNITTLVNHGMYKSASPVNRLAAIADPLAAFIWTGGNMADFTFADLLSYKLGAKPIINLFANGLPTDNKNFRAGPFTP